MINFFIKALAFYLAAPANCEPYPGWNFSVWNLQTGIVSRLRRWLWQQINQPCLIPWLDGLRLYVYPDDEISRSIFLTGYYEPNQFAFLDRVLVPGMTVIDIGANFGLYTLFAAIKVGDYGTVLSIEPSEREIQRLKTNIRTNSLEKRARILEVAVSNHRTEAELSIATATNPGHNTLGRFGYESVQLQDKEIVQVECLDDLVQQNKLQRVDLIKMDIEGAEFFALQGAIETLTCFHPVVLMELSDRTLEHQGCHSSQIWDLLIEHGYQIYTFAQDSGLPLPARHKSYFDAENVIAVHDLSSISAVR